MKRYTELDHDDLVALDEEGVQKLIDIEVAHSGIVPVGKPSAVSLVQEVLRKDDVYFEVGGLLLKNQEDAHTIAGMEIFTADYDHATGGYNYKYAKRNTSLQVESSSFYNQDDLAKAKEIIRDNETKRDEHREAQSEYDDYLKQTSEHHTTIWGAVNEARNRERKVATARETFARYLVLADGDEKIAITFFKKTYKDYSDTIAAVLGNDALTATIVAAEMLEKMEDDGTDNAPSSP
jgi:hypothetical protein